MQHTTLNIQLIIRRLSVFVLALIALAADPVIAAPSKEKKSRKQKLAKPESYERSQSDWKHHHAFITEKPPWVEQRWAQLSKKQRELFEDGLLDVTIYDGWEGNAVDPTGKRDAIKALNHAVLTARDFDLVAYFPAGTYLISGMLNCRHKPYLRYSKRKERGFSLGSRRHTCKLYGARGNRPVIRLQDGAPGFGDPASPQCVVAVWKPERPENLTDYRDNHPAHVYGMIDGIAIDCGRNPGAIGLYYKGAQGSMIAGVHLDATHAYAGLEGGSWAAGSVYDLSVQGGRYGVLIHGNPACYVGLTLLDQTEAALKFDGGAGPATVCGFRIRQKSGPVVTLPNQGLFAGSVHGNLILMDGTVELAGGGTAIDNNAGKNLFLENVYVRGADAAVQSGADVPVSCANGWTRIARYNYVQRTPKGAGSGRGKLSCPSDSLVDGKITKATTSTIRQGEPPPADLVARHRCDGIPEYGDGDPEIKNAVRDLGLDNTGKTSVRAKLQAAIDKHEKILLPRGQYLLDGTLTLRAHTKLFSASPHNTLLVTDEDWKPTKETPIITTENAPDGTAVLSGIQIHYKASPADTHQFNVLTWRVGRRSVLRQVFGKPEWADVGKTPGCPVSSFRVRDGGGGRWFSCMREHKGESKHPDYHILTIENTTEPLTFYNYGGIHARGTGAQTLIRNAQNVRFMGYNLEAPSNDIYHAIKSRNIGIYGIGNVAPQRKGTAVVRLTDCDDVRCAMFAQPKSIRSGNTNACQVVEVREGPERSITADRILSFYERGNFAFPAP